MKKTKAPRSIATQLIVSQFPAYLKRYLLIAYAFSYILWLSALAVAGNEKILINHEIFNWSHGSTILIASTLSSVATLGPFIGFLMVRKEVPANFRKNLNFRGFGKSLGIFLLFATVSSLAVGFIGTAITFSNYNGTLVILALFYFMLTSATEEFGWRGIYYPYAYQCSKSLLESSLITSIVWGLWHTPIVLIIFHYQGISPLGMLPAFILFLASIFLMSYLHGWLNVRSCSVLPNVLLHGLHNWWPVALFAAADESPIAIVIGYIVTLLVLEKFFPSSRYFEADSK